MPKSTEGAAKVSYPYNIEYSSQFEFADVEKSKLVLTLWKDFDNNTLRNSLDKFADSVIIQLSGLEMHVTRDSVLSFFSNYRNQFTTVTSKVDVVMSMRSIDKNEDWVLVWGKEIHNDKANKTDSVSLHEVWRINKEGKVDYMEQLTRSHP